MSHRARISSQPPTSTIASAIQDLTSLRPVWYASCSCGWWACQGVAWQFVMTATVSHVHRSHRLPGVAA